MDPGHFAAPSAPKKKNVVTRCLYVMPAVKKSPWKGGIIRYNNTMQFAIRQLASTVKGNSTDACTFLKFKASVV